MQRRSRCRERILWIFGISIIILLTLSSTNRSLLLETSFEPTPAKEYSQSQVPHFPISITNDADFKKLGFEGNGTEASPYLIGNLSIFTFGGICISIISTSVHFIIQDCELFSSDDDSGTGVHLEKVSNGAVIDCYVHSLSNGITVLKSEKCEIRANKFVKLGKGIYLYQSLWMTVEGNEITKSGYGIHLSKMDESDLMLNIITESDYGVLIENSVEIQTWSNEISGSFFGLYFHNSLKGKSLGNTISKSRYGLYFGYSQDCNVTSSTLTWNKYGLSLLEVDGGTISSNLIRFNSDFGIHLKESREVEILSNTIFDNFGIGLYLFGVSDVSIHNNEIGFNNGVNAADFVGSATKGLVNNWDTNAWSDYMGSISYSISGDRGSQDNDPRYILFVDSPPDLTVEAPANGFINWSASAFKPENFTITVNGVTVEEGLWDGNDISKSFTSLDPGTYTFALSLTTESGLARSDEVILNVQDTTAPIWDLVPEDQVIECGSSLSYQLFASDLYGISSWWVNNSDFSINDGLLQNITSLHYGFYRLEVRAYDPYDNFVTQSLSITVTDSILPSVDSPNDIAFFEGELGHEIVWSVYDCNPVGYEILKDGISVEIGDWSSGTTHIHYSLDDLIPGSYTFTIVLTDIAGNIISDDVQVTVEELTITETPSTPSTSPSTESPTTSDGEMTGLNLITIGLLGIGFAIVIVIVLVVAKRK